MDAMKIAAAIAAFAQAAKALGPLVDDAIELLGSDDEGQIKEALAGLQVANDELQDRVQAKLRG